VAAEVRAPVAAEGEEEAVPGRAWPASWASAVAAVAEEEVG